MSRRALNKRTILLSVLKSNLCIASLHGLALGTFELSWVRDGRVRVCAATNAICCMRIGFGCGSSDLVEGVFGPDSGD
jgi:hypothetical protein